MRAPSDKPCAAGLAARAGAALLACACAGSALAAKRPPKVEIVPDATGFTITQDIRVSSEVRADYDRALQLLVREDSAPGISILGNQEAPKALVIVPWKSSEIGDPLGLAENLDGSRRPVDREVFMRELDYYDIRSGSE